MSSKLYSITVFHKIGGELTKVTTRGVVSDAVSVALDAAAAYVPAYGCTRPTQVGDVLEVRSEGKLVGRFEMTATGYRRAATKGKALLKIQRQTAGERIVEAVESGALEKALRR